MDPNSKAGEWRGKYVPVHPDAKKAVAQKTQAAAVAAKMSQPPQPSKRVNAAELVRETRGTK